MNKNLIIRNSIVYFNDTKIGISKEDKIYIEYSNVEGGRKLESEGTIYNNNLDINPLFVDLDRNDFHLKKSPCVNQGNSKFQLDGLIEDIDGNSRIFDDGVNQIDMGAYEYQSSFNNYPQLFPQLKISIF